MGNAQGVVSKGSGSRKTVPAPPSHPELVAAIVEEIRQGGPMPFVRFMELSLYHPQFGYYMRMDSDGDSHGAVEDRIGWDGDYYTSFDVHPFLAQSLAKQLRQVDELLGSPDPFTIIEMGAGKGLLARDLLGDCALQSEFFARLRYVLIEQSPAMRAAQRSHLASWLSSGARVSWVDRLEDLPSESVAGVFLSNELVDAFPVHRIKIEQGRFKEIFVLYEDGRFSETYEDVSTPELIQYLDRIGLSSQSLPEGFTAEINLHAPAWMKKVAQVMKRGVVITIDYGHTAQDLYSPERRRGTLLCYHDHMTSDDPYTRVGQQDMTAHVDFTGLATVGKEHGLHVTGFTNQMSFLMSWGVEETLSALTPGSAEFQSIVHLLRPEGMGRTFKLLIQHKGIEEPELGGLRFKPFFGSALGHARSKSHEVMGDSVAPHP
jgi:SAM-dependent MidA family methyltransferase